MRSRSVNSYVREHDGPIEMNGMDRRIRAGGRLRKDSVQKLTKRSALLFCLVLAMPVAGQLPEAMDPATAPKTWIEDLRMMMRHGRMEPGLRDTLSKIHDFAKRGQKIRITKQHEFSVFSTSRGILAFRRGIPDADEPDRKDAVFYDSILLGVHASENEPPPLPFQVPSRIGEIPLLARMSKDLPPMTVLNEYEETYFGEKCMAYEYGAGHWIRRLFVKNDRVIAISFGLEP